MVVARLLYAIAPTQFSDGGGPIDAGAVADNVARLAEEGVDSVLLTGAYGEFQSLHDDERVALVTSVKACAESVRIMAGAAHASTDATVGMANRLFDAGADEVMVAPPMLAELTDADVLRHFEHIADNVGGLLAVYNNPMFGQDLNTDVIAHLAALPTYKTIKQGSGVAARLLETVAVCHRSPGALIVLAASDLSALTTLATGADGLTSTNVWVFPAAVQSLARTVATGAHDVAQRIHEALSPYFHLTRRLGQPRTVKAAMQIRGYAGSGSVRLPYIGLGETEQAALTETLRECDEALSALIEIPGSKAS